MQYASFVLELIDEDKKLYISEEEYEKIKASLIDLKFDHKEWQVILYNDKRIIFGLGIYKQNFLSLIKELVKVKTTLV